MNLLLHIGPPKSGTTSIQKSLFLSRDALAEKGIFYFVPEGPRNQGLSMALRNRKKMTKTGVVLRYDTVEESQEAGMKNWDLLVDEVAKRTPKLTVLSEEFFMGTPDKADLFARLSAIFDKITVVAYVRDPVARFNSGLNQRIRGGATLKGMTGRNHRLVPGDALHLKEFDEIFGHDAMLVRGFNRANWLDGSLEKDFASIISSLSGEQVDLQIPEAAVNESVPGAAAAALLLMNEDRVMAGDATDKDAVQKRRNLINRLRSDEAVSALPKMALTDEKIINHIRTELDEEIRWINETYLAGQARIPTIDQPETLTQRELRERLADWLFGYLDADAARVIARASLLPRGKPAADDAADDAGDDADAG